MSYQKQLLRRFFSEIAISNRIIWALTMSCTFAVWNEFVIYSLQHAVQQKFFSLSVDRYPCPKVNYLYIPTRYHYFAAQHGRIAFATLLYSIFWPYARSMNELMQKLFRNAISRFFFSAFICNLVSGTLSLL